MAMLVRNIDDGAVAASANEYNLPPNEFSRELEPAEVRRWMTKPAGSNSGILKGKLSSVQITGNTRITYYTGCSECSKSVLMARLSGPYTDPTCLTRSCRWKRFFAFAFTREEKPRFKRCLRIDNFAISGQYDLIELISEGEVDCCNDEVEFLLGMNWEDNPSEDESLLRFIRTTTYDLEVSLISDAFGPPRCVISGVTCRVYDTSNDQRIYGTPFVPLAPKPYLLTPPFSPEAGGVAGECLIINNNRFDGNVYETRNGSEVDVERLQYCFHEIGIMSIVEEDVRSDQLSGVLDLFKERLIASRARSCFLVIMSHGRNEGIVMADNVICNLWTMFINTLNDVNFPEFRRRPKFVFAQACQNYEPPYSFNNSTVLTHDAICNPRDTHDILVSMSISPGYRAIQTQETGSPYIRAVCHQFMDAAYRFPHMSLYNTEIRKVMDRVADEVHHGLTSPNTQFVHTLYSDLKPFYFPMLPNLTAYSTWRTRTPMYMMRLSSLR